MSGLHFSTMELIINGVLILCILVGLIGKKIEEKKTGTRRPERRKARYEKSVEYSRKHDEADELSAIINAGDEDYSDE